MVCNAAPVILLLVVNVVFLIVQGDGPPGANISKNVVGGTLEQHRYMRRLEDPKKSRTGIKSKSSKRDKHTIKSTKYTKRLLSKIEHGRTELSPVAVVTVPPTSAPSFLMRSSSPSAPWADSSIPRDRFYSIPSVPTPSPSIQPTRELAAISSDRPSSGEWTPAPSRYILSPTMLPQEEENKEQNEEDTKGPPIQQPSLEPFDLFDSFDALSTTTATTRYALEYELSLGPADRTPSIRTGGIHHHAPSEQDHLEVLDVIQRILQERFDLVFSSTKANENCDDDKTKGMVSLALLVTLIVDTSFRVLPLNEKVDTVPSSVLYVEYETRAYIRHDKGNMLELPTLSSQPSYDRSSSSANLIDPPSSTIIHGVIRDLFSDSPSSMKTRYIEMLQSDLSQSNVYRKTVDVALTTPGRDVIPIDNASNDVTAGSGEDDEDLNVATIAETPEGRHVDVQTMYLSLIIIFLCLSLIVLFVRNSIRRRRGTIKRWRILTQYIDPSSVPCVGFESPVSKNNVYRHDVTRLKTNHTEKAGNTHDQRLHHDDQSRNSPLPLVSPAGTQATFFSSSSGSNTPSSVVEV